MGSKVCLSIIINNYNYGSFLQAAIDSALQQTYPDVEVLVVDDGSTDNSADVIAGYGDRIIPIFKHNAGQASALNAGFAHSRGQLVIFLDADDALFPNVAEQVVAAVHAQPNAAKIQYRMEILDALGVPTGTIKPPRHIPLLSGDLRQHYLAFPDDVLRMPTSGNAFPAWALREIMPIPEDGYRGGADTYLTNISALFGSVVSLDEVGAYYRIHSANNFEVTSLNLARVRRNITHSRQTHEHIRKVAARLGLNSVRRPILSMSYVVNRMISLKLEPDQHPIEGDQIPRLMARGIVAAFRRFDTHLAVKVLYALWFIAMAMAPRPLARWLGEKAFFPKMYGQRAHC